jgi:PDZ domain
MRLRPCLAVIGFAACAACAPTVNPTPTPQTETDMRLLAREALSRMDRLTPEPSPCGVGWAESPAGYVVAVAQWAEQAGLRPGDRIVAIAGAPVTGLEERLRGYYQVPPHGPFVLGVIRQGQPVTLSLPCRYQPDLFRAERRTLEAASRGDWDGCVAAAREARRLAGVKAYLTLIREHACMRAKNPSMASPDGRDFAALQYELTQTLLRESRYVPGATENIREIVLGMADELRRSGFPAYASDIEVELQSTMGALPRLQLSWRDNSSDEDGFLIERKIGQAGAYVHLVTLPPNTVTYVDTSVQEGVIYCYRVKAFKAASHSDPTDEACLDPDSTNSSFGGNTGTGRR